MKVVRTPDHRFENLPDWPYEPRYVEVDAADGSGDRLRVAYVDEGPRDGGVILLLHGEPTWGYLYRHMIPVLTAAGHRCIVPDLIGFGRSDKPAEQDDYTYARHVEWMRSVVFDRLDLRDITFFGQDWGGLIGLRLVAAEPDRYARVATGNTGLPTGDGRSSEAFLAWQQFAAESPSFPIGQIVNGGCTTDLPPEVIAAYDAPFPDDTFTAGARRFPALVPTTPDDPARDDNLAAWEVLSQFERPFLCAYSDSDPITKGADRMFLEKVPGTKGQPHTTIEGGGHFLQEDRGAELARVLVDWVNQTSR
jgi:haloalkane dehalogenase